MIQVPDAIKDLLHLDSCKKNIRIHFPNGERTDICNDLIVKDSVQFTESLCSQDTLKFGLCEASVFECEVVGVSNIKGCTIEVFSEIYCDSSVSGAEWKLDLEAWVYAISYGTFVVDEAKRQADMIHRKIVAYGGTANFRPDNEILIAKGRANWSSNTAYTPDIFGTMMMISNSTGRLRDATYTELTPVDVQIEFYGITTVQYIERVVCDCIAYQITNNNQNNLYFFEADKPYKTFEEITNDLYGERPSRTFYKYLQNKFIFGTGEITAPFITGSITMSADYVGMQRGSYIYPYQTINFSGTSSPNYIFMPYKISFERASGGGQSTVYATSEFRDKTKIKIYQVDYSSYPHVTFTVARESNTAGNYRFDPYSIDYLKMFSKALELSGLFGNINRNNMLELIDIKQRFGMNPSSGLYPDTDLYPEGAIGGKLLPQDYQTCWYDDDYTKPFGAVECKFKNTSNVDCIYTYYLTGFGASTPVGEYQTYYLTDNDIVANSTWTNAQIQTMCGVIANSIEGVTYMPVEFVGRGLPYVEAGDTFEILTASNDSITTIVLNRTLSGEQVLTDSYKSV